MQKIDLTGKVAVVTGSGRGLGRAYVEALARSGAAVVVNDLDARAAAEAVDAITAAGAVGTSEAADALVERAVKASGRLDVMCTNAGALRDRTLLKLTDEELDLVLDSHLRGTVTCGGAPVPPDLRRQGTGTVEDVAPLVVYLSSAESAAVTGRYFSFGGDRFAIWSHPKESFVTHRDGGWTPAQLAADFAEYAQHLQHHTKAG